MACKDSKFDNGYTIIEAKTGLQFGYSDLLREVNQEVEKLVERHGIDNILGLIEAEAKKQS